MKKIQKGFSLVELMIVIAIIAILATIAIPLYSNYIARTNVASELAKLQEVKVDASEAIVRNDADVNTADYTRAKESANEIKAADEITTAAAIDETNGVISLDISKGPNGTGVVAGTDASLQLVPNTRKGHVEWECQGTGVDLKASHLPSECAYV